MEFSVVQNVGRMTEEQEKVELRAPTETLGKEWETGHKPTLHTKLVSWQPIPRIRQHFGGKPTAFSYPARIHEAGRLCWAASEIWGDERCGERSEEGEGQNTALFSTVIFYLDIVTVTF